MHFLFPTYNILSHFYRDSDILKIFSTTYFQLIEHFVSSVKGTTDSPLQIFAFRINLGLIVEGPELGHQISGVLCCIYSQCLGDDKERSSKLCNSQLLSRTLQKRKGKIKNIIIIGRIFFENQVTPFLHTASCSVNNVSCYCSPCW